MDLLRFQSTVQHPLVKKTHSKKQTEWCRCPLRRDSRSSTKTKQHVSWFGSFCRSHWRKMEKIWRTYGENIWENTEYMTIYIIYYIIIWTTYFSTTYFEIRWIYMNLHGKLWRKAGGYETWGVHLKRRWYARLGLGRMPDISHWTFQKKCEPSIPSLFFSACPDPKSYPTYPMRFMIWSYLVLGLMIIYHP